MYWPNTLDRKISYASGQWMGCLHACVNCTLLTQMINNKQKHLENTLIIYFKCCHFIYQFIIYFYA